MTIVLFNEKSAERYIQQAIAAFMSDPPDNDYQRGYLECLLVVQREAFNPRARLATPLAGTEG
jgi:hypothetical protein